MSDDKGGRVWVHRSDVGGTPTILPCDLSHDAFDVTYSPPCGQTENITFPQPHLQVVKNLKKHVSGKC